jgi:cystathionine beta-lyase family protein involved in aluminum resistance
MLNASHRGNNVVFVANCYGELVQDLEPAAVGADLVERACSCHFSPATSDGGEALIGADLVATVFSELGFPVHPEPGSHRSDVIQGVRLGAPEPLQAAYRAFQSCSPEGAYLYLAAGAHAWLWQRATDGRRHLDRRHHY